MKTKMLDLLLSDPSLSSAEAMDIIEFHIKEAPEELIDPTRFVPFNGCYDPPISSFPIRVQGMVRIMRELRDTQYLYNRQKLREQIFDILEQREVNK